MEIEEAHTYTYINGGINKTETSVHPPGKARLGFPPKPYDFHTQTRNVILTHCTEFPIGFCATVAIHYTYLLILRGVVCHTRKLITALSSNISQLCKCLANVLARNNLISARSLDFHANVIRPIYRARFVRSSTCILCFEFVCD